MKPKGLGKGLSSLIPDSYIEKISEEKKVEPTSQGLQEIPIEKIKPSHDQPRVTFDQVAMQELMESIREKGILQPLVVKERGGAYEIVCGERRYRACKELGIEKIPAVIRDIADGELLEFALIENIQREDLNAIEEAQGYLKLMEERSMSQDEIARRVGKNRTTVTNSLRILRLPEDILSLIREGSITSGHARALLGLPTADYQRKMAKRVLKEGLSVRQVEDMVNRGNAGKRRAKRSRNLTPEVADLESRLSQKLGTQVRIHTRNNRGRIEIKFFSLDDLDRVMDLLQIVRD